MNDDACFAGVCSFTVASSLLVKFSKSSLTSVFRGRLWLARAASFSEDDFFSFHAWPQLALSSLCSRFSVVEAALALSEPASHSDTLGVGVASKCLLALDMLVQYSLQRHLAQGLHYEPSHVWKKAIRLCLPFHRYHRFVAQRCQHRADSWEWPLSPLLVLEVP